jgi:2-methylfumaryl-CoA hydratase
MPQYLLQGRFFDDFFIGQTFEHAVPRTLTDADNALYIALTGSQYALFCAKTVALACGFKSTPIDNFLVFNMAFGQTVNDISKNAVANLGYAELFFHQPTFSGDTLHVSSTVIGLKENSNGQTGIVYVHSIGINQEQQRVIEWKRWVMIRKNTSDKNITLCIPSLSKSVDRSLQTLPKNYHFHTWKESDSGFQKKFLDLQVGETIIHPDGMTLNSSDHSLATRLYQNNASVHFNAHMMKKNNQQPLVYGGHIISICRALSYHGLGNVLWLTAINSGTHAHPSYAGDTIYCQSHILEKWDIPQRNDLGLVRIQMCGFKNKLPFQSAIQYKNNKKHYHPSLVLDLDYYALMLQ